MDCRANSIGTHNCAHSEDAGVTCNGKYKKKLHNISTLFNLILAIFFSVGCEQGSIRLVGGTVASEGRVEICNDGGYGTVCDDFWGNIDASVVCRQLGFTPLSKFAIIVSNNHQKMRIYHTDVCIVFQMP